MGGKGSGGHNRKPRKLRELQGNSGHRRINKREPAAAPISSSAPPAGMTIGEQEFWKQIFPIVSGMRVMTSADVIALGQLCRFLAEERECSRQIERTGRLIPKKDETGKIILGVQLNPLCRLRSDAARHVRAYLAVFGLGPSFRSAIQVTESNGKAQDPLQDFLDRKPVSARTQ